MPIVDLGLLLWYKNSSWKNWHFYSRFTISNIFFCLFDYFNKEYMCIMWWLVRCETLLPSLRQIRILENIFRFYKTKWPEQKQKCKPVSSLVKVFLLLVIVLHKSFPKCKCDSSFVKVFLTLWMCGAHPDHGVCSMCSMESPFHPQGCPSFLFFCKNRFSRTSFLLFLSGVKLQS